MTTVEKSEIEVFVEKSKTTDVPILLTAKEELKRQIKDNPTPQNVNAYAKVNKELSSAVSENKKTIDGWQNAIAYLKDEHDRKIGHTKFFSDINKGILKKQADGTFKITDLKRYAATLPLSTIPTKKIEKNLNLAEEKTREEIRKSRAIADREEFMLAVKKGQYILKSTVHLELASRAMVLSTSLLNAVRARCLDLIHTVDGNPQKSTEFLNEFEYLLQDALAEYSKEMELEVTFETDFEDDEKDLSEEE